MHLIDKEEFIRMVEDGTFVYLQADKQDVINAINDMPIIDLDKRDSDAFESGFISGLSVKRIEGKWLLCHDTYFSKCSICGDIWLNEECKNYCPNCGADMRGNNHG